MAVKLATVLKITAAFDGVCGAAKTCCCRMALRPRTPKTEGQPPKPAVPEALCRENSIDVYVHSVDGVLVSL